jgi:hypothetical protein
VPEERLELMTNSTLRLLRAEGPHSDLRRELDVFGQFVGSWNVEMFGYGDGSREEFVGEWHFTWVLQGRGVQDVLTLRPRDGCVTQRKGGIGSTLRVYDPAMEAWWISWMCPVDREFSTLLARPVKDRIVLDGQWSLGNAGRRWQWIFSDITKDSFRWECRAFHGAQVNESHLLEEMWAKRNM